jgi:hypothetical protein
LRNIYRISKDASGNLKLKKSKQELRGDEYRKRCLGMKRKLADVGIALDGEAFCIVNVRTLIGCDELKDSVKKFFFKTSMSVPLSVCMRRRTKSHY